jgi:hypothetical protein
VYFFVPETKGRTLEEMDEIFGEVGFARDDLERKARIEREIGLTALLDGTDGPNGGGVFQGERGVGDAVEGEKKVEEKGVSTAHE